MTITHDNIAAEWEAVKKLAYKGAEQRDGQYAYDSAAVGMIEGFGAYVEFLRRWLPVIEAAQEATSGGWEGITYQKIEKLTAAIRDASPPRRDGQSDDVTAHPAPGIAGETD